MLEQCMMERGSGDRCSICPLKAFNQCGRVMESFVRLSKRLSAVDFRLSIDDKEKILLETLYAVIEQVQKTGESQQKIESIAALTSKILGTKKGTELFLDFFSTSSSFSKKTNQTDSGNKAPDMGPEGNPAAGVI